MNNKKLILNNISIDKRIILLKNFFNNPFFNNPFFNNNYFILDNRFLLLETREEKLINLIYTFSSLKVYIPAYDKVNNLDKEYCKRFYPSDLNDEFKKHYEKLSLLWLEVDIMLLEKDLFFYLYNKRRTIFWLNICPHFEMEGISEYNYYQISEEFIKKWINNFQDFYLDIVYILKWDYEVNIKSNIHKLEALYIKLGSSPVD